ncbi:hypothetical protein D3C72_1807560 [compost metagenome]
MLGLGVGGDGLWQCLGVACAREAAHAHIGPCGYQGGSLFGRHDAGMQGAVAHTVIQRHGSSNTVFLFSGYITGRVPRKTRKS